MNQPAEQFDRISWPVADRWLRRMAALWLLTILLAFVGGWGARLLWLMYQAQVPA